MVNTGREAGGLKSRMAAVSESGESSLRLSVIRINSSAWQRCQISTSVAVGSKPTSLKLRRTKPKSFQ